MWEIYGWVRGFNQKLRRTDVSAYASSIAFFLFLSLIPILIVLCSVLPFTPITETDLMKFAMELTPSAMHFLVVGLVNQVYNKSVGVLSIAIIVTIWSAGKGMLALMRGLNSIHEVKEERGYVRLRLVASFYTIMVLLVVIVTLCLGVFGNEITELLLLQISISKWVELLLKYLRVIVMMILLAGVFTLIYTYIPERKLTLKSQLPGAVFVAAAWNICSFGFSVYMEHFSGISAYGTLGTIILLLLWIYFCSYLLLVGAVVNCLMLMFGGQD